MKGLGGGMWKWNWKPPCRRRRLVWPQIDPHIICQLPYARKMSLDKDLFCGGSSARLPSTSHAHKMNSHPGMIIYAASQYIYIYIYIYVCMYMCVGVCVYVCMYVCVCVYIYVRERKNEINKKIRWKDKRKKDIYSVWMKIYFLCWHVFRQKIAYIQGFLFKIISRIKIRIEDDVSPLM